MNNNKKNLFLFTVVVCAINNQLGPEAEYGILFKLAKSVLLSF